MNSIKVDGISMSFQNLLAKICFYHHFSGKQCHSNTTLGGFIPEITEATLLPLVSPFLHQALACNPECLLSMGPSSCVLAVLAEEGQPRENRPDSPVCCSCRTSRLLCLHVQPLYPGPPCLPAGEEGELSAWCSAATQDALNKGLGFPCTCLPVQDCPLRSASQECNLSPIVRPGHSAVPTLTVVPGPPDASGFGTQGKRKGRVGSELSQALGGIHLPSQHSGHRGRITEF